MNSSNGTDIDQLLRSFFRREMPARWRAAPTPETTTVTLPARSMASNRVFVGIALVALLATYIGLATFFPRDNMSGLNPNRAPMIGQRPGVIPHKAANSPEIRP